jgi:hypothetical protein
MARRVPKPHAPPAGKQCKSFDLDQRFPCDLDGNAPVTIASGDGSTDQELYKLIRR